MPGGVAETVARSRIPCWARYPRPRCGQPIVVVARIGLGSGKPVVGALTGKPSTEVTAVNVRPGSLKLVPASCAWMVPELPAVRPRVRVGSVKVAPPAIGPGTVTVMTLPLSATVGVLPSPAPPDRVADTKVALAGTGSFRAMSWILLIGWPPALVGTVTGCGASTSVTEPPGATVAGAVVSTPTDSVESTVWPAAVDWMS